MQSKHAQKYLRIGEAAGVVGVSVDTLRRWADEGKVASVRTLGGERRFLREDLDALYADATERPA